MCRVATMQAATRSSSRRVVKSTSYAVQSSSVQQRSSAQQSSSSYNVSSSSGGGGRIVRSVKASSSSRGMQRTGSAARLIRSNSRGRAIHDASGNRVTTQSRVQLQAKRSTPVRVTPAPVSGSARLSPEAYRSAAAVNSHMAQNAVRIASDSQAEYYAVKRRKGAAVTREATATQSSQHVRRAADNCDVHLSARRDSVQNIGPHPDITKCICQICTCGYVQRAWV